MAPLAKRNLLATLLPAALFACSGPVASPAPQTPLPAPSVSAAPAPPGSGTARCLAPNPGVATPGAPHGVFVLVPGGPAETLAAINQYLLPNPAICGANFWVRWNAVDHGPSASPRYDWSSVETEIAPWEKAGKTVNLIMIGAAEGASAKQGATPTWVLSQVQAVTCANSQPTPVFWQAGYESNWKQFIAQTVARFGSDAHLGYIRFGLGHGGEDLVDGGADSGPCKQLWDAAGYQTGWPAYNERMLDYLGSLHSPKQIMVGLNNFDGKADLGASVAAQSARLGIGFGMQGLAAPDVTAVAQHLPCRDADWCTLFQRYAGKVPLETQTLAASNPAGGPVKPGIPGTGPGSSLSMLTGPLPPLLSTALSVHTQILELYAEDCLIAFDPAWPGYALYHTTYAAAIESAAAVLGSS